MSTKRGLCTSQDHVLRAEEREVGFQGDGRTGLIGSRSLDHQLHRVVG